MKSPVFLSITFCVSSWLIQGCNTGTDETIEGNLALIPMPAEMIPQEGTFILNENTWFQVDSFPGAEFDPYTVFEEVVGRKSGYKLRRADMQDTKPQLHRLIRVAYTKAFENPEQYSLRIRPDSITIHASDARGVFYAFQTLRQIMRTDAVEDISRGRRSWTLPSVDIVDEPAFPYRGLHLDVCRHFMPLEFVKKYIDLLAYYKMNRFHWHLTEDQGWRIEIKKYPRLQEVAAWRDQTLEGHFSEQPDRYDEKRHGGFYTQEQIKDVVKHAADRGVMVIPEIEMPGHCLAALAAYPHLACHPDSFRVGQTWGVFEDVFCPKEETFEFLQHVLDEVIALFPSPYIHIGGDECPKTRWKSCSHCQALIQHEGLKDEHQLQSYFISRIEKYVNRKGRHIIGWDEILEGGLAPNATVMSWRGMEGGIEAARSGHDVIMTPGSHCYFDYYQADPATQPVAIGGLVTLEHVYTFDPVPKELNAEEAKHILGGQANLWTEYIPTPEHAEYMAYPRALALAEVLWTPRHKREWASFVQRLHVHTDRLDGLHVNYAKQFHDPVPSYVTRAKGLDVMWKTTFSGQRIFYSNDTLSGQWQEVAEQDTVTFTARGDVFYKTELSKTYTLHYFPTLSRSATLTSDRQPSERYPGRQGVETLQDGLKGTTHFNGSDWCAWQGGDFTLRLSFDQPVPVDSIRTGILIARGSWIHAPQAIHISGLTPGNEKINIFTLDAVTQGDGRHELTAPAKGLTFSDIFIYFKSYDVIPAGLPGAGSPAWTFVDEIEVR